MSLADLLGLVGLALVDSTSIGTLVLPVLMLLQPRVRIGRFLLYLATVAMVYAAVGIALVGGAGVVVDLASGLGDVRVVRWVELVAGGGLLAAGVLGGPRRAPRPTPAPGRGQQRPRDSWRARLLGPEASYPTVVGVGLLAAAVELGSMIPFLAAAGIISSTGLPVVTWVATVLGYVVVMVLPALLLLVLRLALGAWVAPRLERLAALVDRTSAEAAYWAMAIVGLVLIQDARAALWPE